MTAHSHGSRALLRLLARHGHLPDADGDRLLALAVEQKRSIQEVLAREGIIDEHDLARVVGEVLRLRVLPQDGGPSAACRPDLVKESLARHHHVVPLELEGNTLLLAMANPLDVDAIRAVEFAAGRRVAPVVATPRQVSTLLAAGYGGQASIERVLDEVSEDETLAVTELVDEDIDLRTLAREANLPPVVRLADLVLVEGLRAGASDIHVEPTVEGVLVRYRLNGMLEEAFRFPRTVQMPLISRYKVMSRLDITERRVPQDGRLRLRFEGRNIDVRVATLPMQNGEKVTMRMLDSTRVIRALTELGLTPAELARLREAARRPQGMILVTGPTGSGKTTTLYALLSELRSTTTNIVTIENPVEYQLSGVNQVDINQRQGLTFASVLRSVLRQDPDVILVGEIRDEETARIAFQAAQTGHLVLSTLHTNDAAAALTRLIDLGIDRHVIASSLNAVLAQRLVRTVCPRCRDTYEPPADALAMLRLDRDRAVFVRGTGCATCRSTGFGGRVGVYEIIPIGPVLAKRVGGGASEGDVRQLARAQGFGSMADDALARIAAGHTTVEEVLRVLQLDDAPAHAAAGSLDTPAAVTPARAVPAPSTFTVLVVEDDPAMRQLIRTNLECAGLPLAVLTAGSGGEALALAGLETPHLVVLDVGLPDLDGYEVCRRLRAEERTRHVPVLMITGRAGEEDLTRGFVAGTDDYLVKPYRQADLLARVRRMLEREWNADFGSRAAPKTA